MRTETQTWTGSTPGYCEGVPSGDYAFNVPGVEVRTSRGTYPLPPGYVSASYLRIANDGRRLIVVAVNAAGGGDRGYVYNNGWIDLGVTAFGPNSVIFDAQDLPRVITVPPAVGYRYVAADGTIVSCEATYADPARGLYEYTDFGDVAIGQGGKDVNQGAVVRFADDGVLRRFADGVLRNIRVRRDGELVAVSMCNYPTATATITWCTLAELRALPPVVVPPPVDPPKPPKEPDVSLPDPSAVKAALERERNKYPATVTNNQSARIVNDAALQFPHCGLMAKSPGENTATLPNGVTVNRNVMRYLPPGDDFGWWSDVLGAAGAGISTPLAPDWQRSTDDRRSFVPPVSGVPPPDPPDQPPAADTVTRAELAAALSALRTEMFQADAIVLREAISNAPTGLTEARVKQILAGAKIEGDTSETGSSFLRHAHGKGSLRIVP